MTLGHHRRSFSALATPPGRHRWAWRSEWSYGLGNQVRSSESGPPAARSQQAFLQRINNPLLLCGAAAAAAPKQDKGAAGAALREDGR